MPYISEFQSERQSFIVSLDQIEQAARKLGMFETMHAINKAKNVGGHELAYLIEQREKRNRAASAGALAAHTRQTTAK